jgi:hypothetical protein
MVLLGCIATNSGRWSVSIGAARDYKGKAIGKVSELLVGSGSSELLVGRGRSELLVGAVQFRQWDPKELRVLSVYYNCNLL